MSATTYVRRVASPAAPGMIGLTASRTVGDQVLTTTLFVPADAYDGEEATLEARAGQKLDAQIEALS